jgi:hypothetical protein
MGLLLQSIKPPAARAAVVWMAGGDFGQGPEVGMAVLKVRVPHLGTPQVGVGSCVCALSVLRTNFGGIHSL